MPPPYACVSCAHRKTRKQTTTARAEYKVGELSLDDRPRRVPGGPSPIGTAYRSETIVSGVLLRRRRWGWRRDSASGAVLIHSAPDCQDHTCDESDYPTNDRGRKAKLDHGKRSCWCIDEEANNQPNDRSDRPYEGRADRSPASGLRQAA
jgi:hypothetical protein